MTKKLCSRRGTFKLMRFIYVGLLISCSEPNLVLNDEELEVLNLFVNKTLIYTNSMNEKIEMAFEKNIETTVFDNRGIFNSFYDKTWSIKSTKREINVSITKSTLGPSSIVLSLLGNKSVTSFDSLMVHKSFKIDNFELSHPKLDYLIFEKGVGIVKFKFSKDQHPYVLASQN